MMREVRLADGLQKIEDSDLGTFECLA
jgi:hypothetical protein